MLAASSLSAVSAVAGGHANECPLIPIEFQFKPWHVIF